MYTKTEVLSIINSLQAKLGRVDEKGGILENLDIFFVPPNRIEALKNIKNDSYDLSRVIRFCEEINSNFKNKNFYSIAFLIRAMIDHLPPIFGKANFADFVSQLSRSTKDLLSPLNEKARRIADRAIHTQIGQREPLMSEAQIGFQKEFDVLLEEVLKGSSRTGAK